MRRLFGLVVLAVFTLDPLLAHAVQPAEMLSDPQLEARARAISVGLRCLVCQNESIDESNATLAHDIRVLVRERVLAGDSDDQIRNFLVSRYGSFILLKPPFEPGTYLLWLTPLLLLLAGGSAIYLNARRKPPTAPATLTPVEETKLAQIVGQPDDH
jgi:cytochrome c-type biogenesis protein CcmH